MKPAASDKVLETKLRFLLSVASRRRISSFRNARTGGRQCVTRESIPELRNTRCSNLLFVMDLRWPVNLVDELAAYDNRKELMPGRAAIEPLRTQTAGDSTFRPTSTSHVHHDSLLSLRNGHHWGRHRSVTPPSVFCSRFSKICTSRCETDTQPAGNSHVRSNASVERRRCRPPE